ncbi:hypothetical protein RclHR1_03670010 [Rhizophagus clarus]|uniref:Uncharacterized protein n=1 Tax=Rhizophagus clarus TaxID=94130 RepID=A0A2Z6RD42_9GLOM|nr:hypothetical protein RclHR1_03670010 [Rhizophagus clarus]GES88831.1 hypothetical protein GLOIN_2v1547638 [Rhizophagus clarus]
MKKYARSFPTFILLITLIIVLISVTLEAKPEKKKICRKQGHVEFFPDFNKDNLYGVITFSESSTNNKVIVDGIFSVVIGGVDGIKTEDGDPRYTAELYNKNGIKLYDLTESVFHNAMELVSFNRQYANLQICDEKNGIIGNLVVIKRGGEEIARAEIYELF